MAMDVCVATAGEARAPGGPGIVHKQDEALMMLGNVGPDPSWSIRVRQVGGDMGRPAGKRLGKRPKPILTTRDKHELDARLT